MSCHCLKDKCLRKRSAEHSNVLMEVNCIRTKQTFDTQTCRSKRANKLIYYLNGTLAEMPFLPNKQANVSLCSPD
jgi:hypothetical protein